MCARAACGVSSCLTEAQLLLEVCNHPTTGVGGCQFGASCATAAHKVSLVLDGGNINDGTFNQLAFEGAYDACNAGANCCLEVEFKGGSETACWRHSERSSHWL